LEEPPRPTGVAGDPILSESPHPVARDRVSAGGRYPSSDFSSGDPSQFRSGQLRPPRTTNKPFRPSSPSHSVSSFLPYFAFASSEGPDPPIGCLFRLRSFGLSDDVAFLGPHIPICRQGVSASRVSLPLLHHNQNNTAPASTLTRGPSNFLGLPHPLRRCVNPFP
jgi:hypothetical protein